MVVFLPAFDPRKVSPKVDVHRREYLNRLEQEKTKPEPSIPDDPKEFARQMWDDYVVDINLGLELAPTNREIYVALKKWSESEQDMTTELKADLFDALAHGLPKARIGETKLRNARLRTIGLALVRNYPNLSLERDRKHYEKPKPDEDPVCAASIIASLKFEGVAGERVVTEAIADRNQIDTSKLSKTNGTSSD
ncbi:hypothetical protein L0664_16490 [Octadecabacter sp. G9-8]|uniref:Terminase small subunit n=1 Tax=Octadecabacter dasysiphoniae TaxID=2909341 RepID=A0ABS9D020_9RHOB|nr:hypothetical protein [Octadecabacter dasysiphoniae]MCF2872672.1 hypothetical protein [Octadecabacter dasysiphoniae]